MREEAIELCRPSLSRNFGTLDCVDVGRLFQEVVVLQSNGFTPLWRAFDNAWSRSRPRCRLPPQYSIQRLDFMQSQSPTTTVHLECNAQLHPRNSFF